MNHNLNECKEKLKTNPKLSLIYMWVKQDHINLKEFVELIKEVTND